MMTDMNRRMILSLFACLLLAVLASNLVDANASNYSLATAAKDKHTNAFLNGSEITYNGTTFVGNPWAQFTVPSNADTNVTHAMAGYYADADIYFFDAQLPNCRTTPTCTISNNGYETYCVNASDSSTGVYTERYSCEVEKNNIVFFFTYYPTSNGVLTTNHLVSTNYVPPEIEDFGANATVGVNPLTVRFEPNITFNNGSTVDAIEWNFGDGSTISNEYNTTHTFQDIGNYTVQLTVFDSNGLVDRENITIQVRPLPVVNFTANVTNISAGQAVELVWTTQYADNVTIDNGIGSVELNGTRVVTPTATTAYTLTASNADGNTVRTVTITVTPANPDNGGGGGNNNGDSSSSSASSSSGRRSGGGGGSRSVVLPVRQETVDNDADKGTSEAVDMSVSVPELHVNQPASILVTLQSTKKMDVTLVMTVNGVEIEDEPRKITIDGTVEEEYIYIPREQGAHEFVVTMTAADGTEVWHDTVVVQPEVVEQNITTGMSLGNLLRPMYIAILLSLVAIGLVVWKRDEIRKYLNI